MNQPTYILKNGTRVRMHDRLGPTGGMFVPQGFIDARRPATLGVIAGVVMGHGGDVYWVRHIDGTMAPYCFDEFELDAGMDDDSELDQIAVNWAEEQAEIETDPGRRICFRRLVALATSAIASERRDTVEAPPPVMR
jgi:hypothetical protein